MKKLFTLFAAAMASLSMMAIDYYGRAIAVVDEPNTGYVWVTLKGTKFDGNFTEAVADTSSDGAIGTWDHSYKVECYAKPAQGYVFEGWFDSQEAAKPISTDFYYSYKFSAKSQNQNAPTESYCYARFVELESAQKGTWYGETPQAGEYYLLNMQNLFLSADGVTANPNNAACVTLKDGATSTLQVAADMYVYQSKGNADWGSNALNWNISLLSNGYYRLSSKSGDNYNRLLSLNNATSLYYPKEADGKVSSYSWLFISKAQYQAWKGSPTALPEQKEAVKAAKVLRNGQLLIRREETLFDLNGRRVK